MTFFPAPIAPINFWSASQKLYKGSAKWLHCFRWGKKYTFTIAKFFFETQIKKKCSFQEASYRTRVARGNFLNVFFAVSESVSVFSTREQSVVLKKETRTIKAIEKRKSNYSLLSKISSFHAFDSFAINFWLTWRKKYIYRVAIPNGTNVFKSGPCRQKLLFVLYPSAARGGATKQNETFHLPSNLFATPPPPGPQTNWKASRRWGPQKTMRKDICALRKFHMRK